MSDPKAAARHFTLDRRQAVPALIGRHEDFLHISGLAGTVYDIAAATNRGANFFGLVGAMGAACAMGLGLALARPDKQVLVTTGDGEMLMALGSLATIGFARPKNLSVLCVDNGHYLETGNQESHTVSVVDLEQIARGAGIKRTATVETEAEIPAASRLLRQGGEPAFVLLRVTPTAPPKVQLDFDGALVRDRFRKALRKNS